MVTDTLNDIKNPRVLHGEVLHVQEEVYQSTLTFKESSRVPRMMPLIHPVKNFDLLVLHIPPNQGQNTSPWT